MEQDSGEVIKRETSLFQDCLRDKYPAMSKIIWQAFVHGAVIAGGFAKTLYQKREIPTEWWTSNSDIDLFFPDAVSCSMFMKLIELVKFKNITITKQDSTASNAIDVMLYELIGNDMRHFKIQVITCKYGTPEHILSTFDMHNCMIAFNDEFLWKHKELDSVEQQNLISVANWSNPLLASRIAKYLDIRGYSGLVDRDREKLCKWLSETYQTIPKNGLMPGFKFLDRNNFRHQISKIMKAKNNAITTEELSEFFPAFDPSETGRMNYNKALNEQNKRLGLPHIDALALQLQQENQLKFNKTTEVNSINIVFTTYTAEVEEKK